MMTELKEYHFTDEQIDFILELVRSHAKHFTDVAGEYLPSSYVASKFMTELANIIEDQIVNHHTNA